jgi:hypothetical protein
MAAVLSYIGARESPRDLRSEEDEREGDRVEPI